MNEYNFTVHQEGYIFVEANSIEEAESSGWYYQPILLILDDGTALCPMSDDEGNESGAIACMGEKVEVETIPVMRERI